MIYIILYFSVLAVILGVIDALVQNENDRQAYFIMGLIWPVSVFVLAAFAPFVLLFKLSRGLALLIRRKIDGRKYEAGSRDR